MLRITLREMAEATEIRLEGRLAGSWASELDRVWTEAAQRLREKRLVIDLHNVTYADAAGKKILRAIYGQTHADFVATTPWTQFLAQELTATEVSVGQGE